MFVTLRLRRNEGLAKNIVIVVGDGMSLSTVAAARIYKGQRAGRDGPSSRLTWEAFPHFGLSKTYCLDAMVPDSSSTASAIFSGVKTNYYTVGFDASIVRNNPHSQVNASRVETVLDWAQAAGMRTGIVTTTRITHATPSALYAKTAQRDWECATKMPTDRPAAALDIASQLVELAPGRDVDVVLGGGLSAFMPENFQVAKPEDYFSRSRTSRSTAPPLIYLPFYSKPRSLNDSPHSNRIYVFFSK